MANVGDVTQDLRTYSVNAYTAQGGGFESAVYGTPPNEVTSWLEYPDEVFTLEPTQGVERTFVITVPEGTDPGQYITSVAAEQTDSTGVEGTEIIIQNLRYTVPVFITVPGETIAGFEIGEVSLTLEQGVIVLVVPIKNTGDVRVRPEGSIEIVSQDGQLASSIPVAMESVYARDQTVLAMSTEPTIQPGTYRVKVTLTDPDTGETASGVSADVFIDPLATPVVATIVIASATVAPAPAAGNVQFANVEAVIANDGDPIANAQLSLIARVNGEEVERFPISQSLSLPTGDTPVSTRYIPATGWTSGQWTFELLLETVEPSGAAVVVGRLPIEGTITIP